MLYEVITGRGVAQFGGACDVERVAPCDALPGLRREIERGDGEPVHDGGFAHLPGEGAVGVITSYSIHYTKLYEYAGCFHLSLVLRARLRLRDIKRLRRVSRTDLYAVEAGLPRAIKP